MAIGYTTTVKYGDSNPATTLVGQILDASAPEAQVDSVETTNNDSASGLKEFIPGLQDNGQFTFQALYLKTRETALRALLRATKYWRITLPDSSTYDFQGFITSMGTALPRGENMVNNLTIKITGAVTFTAA